MGDFDFDIEDVPRPSRRRYVAGTAAAIAAVVASGALVHAQVPEAVALNAGAAAVTVVPAEARDSSATLVAGRLAAAAGRSLDGLAKTRRKPVTAMSAPDAPVVGAQAGSDKYADTLAELATAESEAAEQLRADEDKVNRAESKRKSTQSGASAQEDRSAAAVDAAIDAAIAAAKAVPAAGAAAAPLTPQSAGAPVKAAGGAVPKGEETSPEQVLSLVRKHFPADQVSNAMAVARCESGHGNRVSEPNDDGTRDFGIFQINDGGTLQAALKRIDVGFDGIDEARKRALDPATNVRLARAIWQTRGWQPWVCAAELQIVAGLYQRTPGQMAGKYDDYGRL